MKVLHDNASAAELGVCRLALYGIWLVTLLTNPLWNATDLPVEWATLPGPANFLPGPLKGMMLSPGFLVSLEVALLMLCVALLAGVRPFTPLALAFAILILLYDATWKSFQGYINHDKFVSIYAAWIIAIFPAADSLSILGTAKAQKVRDSICYRAPIIAIALVLSLTYMAIGLRRVVLGDVRIFLGETMPTYFSTRSMMYSYSNFKLGLLVLTFPAFYIMSKVGLFIATFFELSSPWTLLSKRLRYAWLLVMLPFHALTIPLLNIIFWENMVLIVFFMTDLPEWLAARYVRKRE